MVETVSTDEVKRSIENNEAAVVNVLAREHFETEHIPGSTNIPGERAEERFPKEFDEDDEIIVYCASEDCPGSPAVAETLESMGFENVKDYEGGMAGWKDRGYEVESTN